MFFKTVVLDKVRLSGLRHFIYSLVCALLCGSICCFIDTDITSRDGGVQFGIYIFITRVETFLTTQYKQE